MTINTDANTLFARSCYNHIAGQLGVMIADRLIAHDVIVIAHGNAQPGPAYHAFLSSLGMAEPVPRKGQPPVKLCLDWTERRHHLSGPFATELMRHVLAKDWLQRQPAARALILTETGKAGFHRHMGLEIGACITGA